MYMCTYCTCTMGVGIHIPVYMYIYIHTAYPRSHDNPINRVSCRFPVYMHLLTDSGSEVDMTVLPFKEESKPGMQQGFIQRGGLPGYPPLTSPPPPPRMLPFSNNTSNVKMFRIRMGI